MMQFGRSNNITNISKNIKEQRLRRNLNQKEFAKLLDMNYQNYSKMERGVYIPSLDKILEICSALEITPNDLLLDGREYDDYKDELFDRFDSNVLELANEIKICSEIRAKAKIAQLKGDEKAERAELDQLIQIFYWQRTDQMRELADLLVKNAYDKRLNKIYQNTCSQLEQINLKTIFKK